MPDRSERLLDTASEASEYELPYISKSRAMSWIKNPEHFRLKYMEDIRPGETDAMVRGSRIHEAFEEYYDYTQNIEGYPALLEDALPDNRQLWADFIEPYISNFFLWETEREGSSGEAWQYVPVAVEEERWVDPQLGLDGEPEWMGLADVILPAGGVPAVPENEGVVVVDFKTGSVPDKKYRSTGIYTELEYYRMLFEDKYNVAAAGAYYPKENTFVTQPNNQDYRDNVVDAVTEMVQACRDYEGGGTFEHKEGPLCKWGFSEDQESDFYGVCSGCTWGKPAKNPETFKALVSEGRTNNEIAEALGCSTDAVGYWKYKMDL